MTDVAIRVEGLTKRFRTVTALDGIDLEIPPRTVFGPLGPNGADGSVRAPGRGSATLGFAQLPTAGSGMNSRSS
jgi:hypothetical protein